MQLPETKVVGNARYFPRDSDLLAIRWCTASGTTLEGLATKVGVPRVNLSLMLKGVDPVPVQVEKKLRELIGK